MQIKADDASSIWVNGTLLGSGNNWQTLYNFTIPQNLLTANGTNLIAVQAADVHSVAWWVSFKLTFCDMATLLPDVIILPITLLSFSAQKQAQQSLLTWQISGNCAYFEIERQTQNAPFQLIGEKVSFVEGQENYDFIDAFPQVGKNTYRLKTTDIDGQISYSDKVVELSFETENMTITAYPNPVNDEILLQTAFSNEKEMTVFLYDIQGKEVLKQVLQEENGKYALNLKNVSTGLYVLKTTMQESGKTSFTKIVKKE